MDQLRLRERDRAQLREATALLARLLGNDLVGVYLHGSSVLAGLRPHSDLDVLAIAARPLGAMDRARLVEALLQISRPPGDAAGRPLEIVVAVHGDVRPWRYPPRHDFIYGEWMRPEFAAGELSRSGPAESADLALLIAVVLRHGVTLAGPPAAEVLDAVPAADLRRATTSELDALLEDLAADTRNVLLTLARAWVTLEDDEIVPKDVAAARLLSRLSPGDRRVLAHARAIYLGDTAERWDGFDAGDIEDCARRLVREVERLNGNAT